MQSFGGPHSGSSLGWALVASDDALGCWLALLQLRGRRQARQVLFCTKPKQAAKKIRAAKTVAWRNWRCIAGTVHAR